MFLFGLAFFLPVAVFADEEPAVAPHAREEPSKPEPGAWQVSASVRYGILAGGGDAVFPLDRLFENAVGGSVEVSRRVFPGTRLHGGVAYDRFGGKSAVLPSGPGRFESLSPVSFYAGARFYPFDLLGDSTAALSPFLRVDLGGTYFNEARFGGAPAVKKGVGFAYGIGAGLDLFVSNTLALFLEAKYQDFGFPDEKASSLKVIPISLGLRFRF